MWLAIQTFIGLVLVSVAVYIATAASLTTQQTEFLAQKQAVVTHLLNEAQHDGDLSNLKHRLDDFLVGRTDLALELFAQGGAPIYPSPHDQVTAKRVRSVQFSLSSPTGAVGDVTAQLSLDTRADDELLRRLMLILAAAALFGALLVSAGGFALVRFGLAPVQHLVDQTKNLAAATLDRRLYSAHQTGDFQSARQCHPLCGSR